MATKKPEAESHTDAAPEGAGASPGRGKKVLVLALALVLVLGGAGVGWFFWHRHKMQQELDEGEEEVSSHEAEKPDAKHPPAYLPLDTMVVNLADAGGERVAQVGVTLELVDEKAPEKVKPYLPSIRNDVLLLMSQKKAEELLSREGKEQLAAEILAAASGYLPAEDGGKGKKGKPEGPIRRVLFASLIIQ